MPKRDSTQAKIAMIMNPMEMTLTKDHIKVLLHIVPKTETQSFLCLPSLDSMAHYKYLNEMCMTMKTDLIDQRASVDNSSIKRYIKNSGENDTTVKVTSSTSSLSALAATPTEDDQELGQRIRDRRMSLKTSLEWDHEVISPCKVPAAAQAIAQKEEEEEEEDQE